MSLETQMIIIISGLPKRYHALCVSSVHMYNCANTAQRHTQTHMHTHENVNFLFSKNPCINVLIWVQMEWLDMSVTVRWLKSVNWLLWYLAPPTATFIFSKHGRVNALLVKYIHIFLSNIISLITYSFTQNAKCPLKHIKHGMVSCHGDVVL